MSEILVNGIILGSFYALFAASLTLIFGVMDIPNLAHGALFAMGGYLFVQIYQIMGFHLIIAIFGTIILVSIISVAIEVTLFRPLYKRDESDYIFGIILVTFGLAQIFERLFAQIWGHESLSVRISVLENRAVIFGNSVTYSKLLVLGTVIALFLFLYLLIFQTEFGLKIRAIVEDRRLAYNRGIDIKKVYSYTFALGASMVAIAGILNSLMFNVYPGVGFELLIKSFVIVILAGLGRVISAGVAGFGLGVYESYAINFLSGTDILMSEFGLLILYFIVKSILESERINFKSLHEMRLNLEGIWN
jgi:branched-subunit amino acid ABC-type transport system permease component